MQNQIITSKVFGLALAALFVALAVVASPISAHAADFSDEGGSYYDYSYSDSSSGGGSNYDYSYPDTTTSSSGGSYYDYSYPDTSTPSGGSYYDYSYPDTTTSSGGSYYDYSYPETTSNGGSYYDYSYPDTTTYIGGGTYTTGGGCYGNCGGGHYTPPTPPQVPSPTCTINASVVNLNQAQNVNISWSSTNAVRGNISNLGTNIPVSGSHSVYVSQTTTFTGTFYNSVGQSVNCATTVTVTPPHYCPAGYTGTYPNCYPPQTYNNPSCTITINNYGTNYNNGSWNPNSAVTISWNSANASYGTINNGLGSVNLSGSRTVYPTQTTTYTGTFYGYNGQSVTCAATVYINGYVPPVYPNTPYVTLSAVPYTGLDLGPVGTVVYWGFIAFWCLLAAYLIAIKKVHNQVYASLAGLLFGSKGTPAAAHSAHVSYTTPVVKNEDKTDDFILSQINRVRA